MMKIIQLKGSVWIGVIYLLIFLRALPAADGIEKSTPQEAELGLLTLDKAIAIALENNAEYKAHLESIGVASGGITQATKRPNPELEWELLSDRLFANRGDKEYGMALTQMFEMAGKRKYRILAARAYLEKTKSEVENFERWLISEVKSSFFTVLAAERQLELVKEMIKVTEDFVKTQAARGKEGDIPELHINLAEVELSRGLRRSIQAETALRTGRLRLSQLLGVSPGARFQITGEMAPALAEYEIDVLVAWAIRNRPDLKTLENELKWQEYDLSLKKAAAKPNLKLGFELQHKRDVFDAGDFRYTPAESSSRSSLPTIFPGPVGLRVAPGGGSGLNSSEGRGLISSIDSKDWLLRFRINFALPLFNRNQGQIESARAGRKAAALKLRYLQESVKVEIMGDYETLRLAQKARALYETGILPQQRENMHVVMESYQLGAQSILAVLQEQRNFFEVNSQYLQALSDFQSAFIRLESALGGSLAEVARQ